MTNTEKFLSSAATYQINPQNSIEIVRIFKKALSEYFFDLLQTTLK